MKTFLKEVLLPLLIALCLAAFFKPVYMEMVYDYFLMYALPYSASEGCASPCPRLWHIKYSRNLRTIIIGGLIGGLALIAGLLFGVIHTIREIIEYLKSLRGFVSFSNTEHEADLLPKAGIICSLQMTAV